MDREKVVERIYEAIDMGVCVDLFMDVLELLKEQEAIVRCKDCKHYKRYTCSAGAGMAFPPPDDWFCADGERRTDDA